MLVLKFFKYQERKPLIRKWLFVLLILPWIFLAPILMRFEVRSFHLKDTWNLSKDERRIYFVKKEFNAIGDQFDDDYFELLKRAHSIISPDSSPFLWFTSENLSKTQNLRALIYAFFWLAPSVGPKMDDKVFYKIYYQTDPDSKNEVVIDKIEGEKPSYITKVVR